MKLSEIDNQKLFQLFELIINEKLAQGNVPPQVSQFLSAFQ